MQAHSSKIFLVLILSSYIKFLHFMFSHQPRKIVLRIFKACEKLSAELAYKFGAWNCPYKLRNNTWKLNNVFEWQQLRQGDVVVADMLVRAVLRLVKCNDLRSCVGKQFINIWVGTSIIQSVEITSQQHITVNSHATLSIQYMHHYDHFFDIFNVLANGLERLLVESISDYIECFLKTNSITRIDVLFVVIQVYQF